jgi:hypothetical protein
VHGVKARLPLSIVTTGLAAAALAGALISWFAIFVVLGPPHGCLAMGVIILFGATLLFALFWLVAATLVGVGSVLSFKGSRVGPYLTALGTLPLIAFFGWWDPVAPGQVVWGWMVVAFGCLPFLALLGAARQLVAKGLSGHVAGALVVLLLGGLQVPWLGHGWALDLGYAYQMPPPTAAPSTPC